MHDISLTRSRRRTVALSTADPQWYKDAVVYELHVRAFADGNDHHADGASSFHPRNHHTGRYGDANGHRPRRPDL